MEVGPCIPVGIQREKAGVGPTSGPTGHISHLARVEGHGPLARRLGEAEEADGVHLGLGRIVASEIKAPNMLLNLV